jgi:hypothetical protein
LRIAEILSDDDLISFKLLEMAVSLFWQYDWDDGGIYEPSEFVD